MRYLLPALLLCLLATGVVCAANQSNDSFSKSKRLLLERIYTDYHQTFYCASQFDNHKKISHTGGYVPYKEGQRAYRLEWEHIVPAEAFGNSFAEWRQGNAECVSSAGKSFKGRKCAEKVNRVFRYMQADMHNLVPAIGEVNGLRSNYSYAMIPGEERRFGSCDMEISGSKAEPPEQIRGDIARTYFYMDEAYPGRGIISGKNRKLFQAWDRQDPVDAWECERERRVHALQGNGNHFVSDVCGQVQFISRIQTGVRR